MERPLPPDVLATRPDPGTVRVEWVGEVSPLDDPFVTIRYELGQISEFEMSVLREAARLCLKRVDGTTYRHFGRRDGLSRDYWWGPERGSYVQAMRHRDADRLFAINGHEFRNLDGPAPSQIVTAQPEIKRYPPELVPAGTFER